MNRAPRVYLDHGEAYGNLGDEAMLMNATRRIRERLGEVKFVLPHQKGAPLPDIGSVKAIPPPRHTVSRLATRAVPLAQLRDAVDARGINPFPRLIKETMVSSGGIGTWRGLVKELRRCDAVYCVGAANLNDFARYGCLLPKCMLIEQAHRLGIPVIVSSQTVGPLDLPWTQRAVVRAVNHSDHFSLRDGGLSEELLVSLGLDREQLLSVGDEAFSLPPASRRRVEQYLTEHQIDMDRPLALFHFRGTDYTRSTACHYRKIAKALDGFEGKTQILFVPMSYWRHSGNDQSCGMAIREHMEVPDRLRVLRPPRDARVVRGLVEGASWVMSLSYHLQVFALAAGCPFAVLSSGEYYRFKAKGMQMMIDGQVRLLDLDNVGADELTTAMARLETDRAQLIAALKRARSRVSQTNDAPVDALAGVLAQTDERL